MGYLKLFLGEKADLKKELETHPERLDYYSKFEFIIGPHDSVQYLLKALEKL